jgi:nucleotide-binding universal stress UspA family protein
MSVRRLEPGQVIGGFKLEAPDPAAAILEYAVTNQVDHIIVGARVELQPTALSRQCVLARSRRRPAR